MNSCLCSSKNIWYFLAFSYPFHLVSDFGTEFNLEPKIAFVNEIISIKKPFSVPKWIWFQNHWPDEMKLDTILGLGAVFFRRPCWQISYLLAKLQNCNALAIHWPSNDRKHALHCNQNIWSRGNYGIDNDLFKMKSQEDSSWLKMVTRKVKIVSKILPNTMDSFSPPQARKNYFIYTW